ncbi:MAG: hypothetical protein ACP5QN_01350 [Minisyncoccia bacterium]
MDKKQFWCLKHHYPPNEDKVKKWCLRWNCKHLRGKHKKINRFKNKIVIEIKQEIILFESSQQDDQIK